MCGFSHFPWLPAQHMILLSAKTGFEKSFWTKGVSSQSSCTTLKVRPHARRRQNCDEGFGLAAFLLLSGILARLQATGLNSPNDTRFLLDQAILTLENMPVQDEAIRKARVALEHLLVLPGGE